MMYRNLCEVHRLQPQRGWLTTWLFWCAAKPVYLVGAGPGDARLFTEKGLDCVRKADVIVYDNLISGSILNEARLDAELIYAGKRSGSHHMKQEEISAPAGGEGAGRPFCGALKGR